MDCPKRTGFNMLLFGEMAQADRCSDAVCFNNKISRTIERRIEAKPQLVQIATAHGTHGDGAVLPRNRYVTLTLTNPAKSKQPLSPYQKPCKDMAEAIVVDGVERGHTTKVCAEPTCAVHFADRRKPDPAQMAKEKDQRRKELEKRKLDTTVRHRTLAEVLKKVSSPLDRGDLVLIADSLLERTEPLRREAMAKRHKMVDGSSNEVTYPMVQKGLQRLLRQLDESGLSRLIVEIVLLGSAESTTEDDNDALLRTAKRHRVDITKVRTAVAAEFTARATKTAAKQKKTAPAKASKVNVAA
jgi:ParB family chromosome partitioning protein